MSDQLVGSEVPIQSKEDTLTGRRGPGFATRAIHAGQEPDRDTGAVTVPIYQTSTFAVPSIGSSPPYEYSRLSNPTRTALETSLASLERGSHALAFASGSAAALAVFSLVPPGEHIVAVRELYGGTYRLLSTVVEPHGARVTYAHCSLVSLEEAITRTTRLIWVETPTNPLLHLVDLEGLAQLAHARGALLAVDNTFATPYLQQPLALGADISVHSTTKYLGGHSDVVGGGVAVNDDGLYQRLRVFRNASGGVPGPFDAWLVLRGIKTLAVRMDRHQHNAMTVARFLAEHPLARDVVYPGLPDYPQAELAARQMSGSGAMVTFTLPGGREQADRFTRALKLFILAVSLGGVESLVSHPATMSHAAYPPEERERLGIHEGTLRLSVGIEDEADLISDLEQAMAAAAR